jgi:hypothetical protein
MEASMADKDDDKPKRIRLQTPPFIAMWPNLFKAKKSDLEKDNPEAKAKYGLTAVFDVENFTPRDKKRWKAIMDALNERSMEAHGKPWAKLKADKKGVRPNEERDTPFDFVGDGAMFANLTTTSKPGVVHITEGDVAPEEGNDDLVYSGMWCQATVNVFDYNNKSRGVALGLNNVRILVSDEKKAPRRDGRKAASEDFDDEGDSEFLNRFDEDEEEVEDKPRRGKAKPPVEDDDDDPL